MAPLDRKSLDQLLEAVKPISYTATADDTSSRRDYAAILLAVRLGLHRKAICDLQIEDVSLDTRELHVTLRGGRQCIVSLSKEVTTALGVWMKWLQDHGVEHGPLFRALAKLTVDGIRRPLSYGIKPEWLYKLFKICGQVVGLEIRPSTLRETCLVELQAQGLSALEIERCTGQRFRILKSKSKSGTARGRKAVVQP